VQKLVDEKTEGPHAFLWQQQLRFYWTPPPPSSSSSSTVQQGQGGLLTAGGGNGGSSGTAALAPGELGCHQLTCINLSFPHPSKTIIGSSPRDIDIRICDYRCKYFYEWIGNTGACVCMCSGTGEPAILIQTQHDRDRPPRHHTADGPLLHHADHGPPPLPWRRARGASRYAL